MADLIAKHSSFVGSCVEMHYRHECGDKGPGRKGGGFGGRDSAWVAGENEGQLLLIEQALAENRRGF